MGFSISWIGFKSLDEREILARTGFRDTGAIEGAPESPFCFAALPTAWSIVYAQDVRYAAREGLAQLSAGATVLGVQVEEHSMVDAAALYEDGRQVWSVAHDSNVDRSHLDTEGHLPPQFDAIRRRLFARQAAERATDPMRVDFVFDVPIELAASLTGYRHDEEPSWGRQSFRRLDLARP